MLEQERNAWSYRGRECLWSLIKVLLANMGFVCVCRGYLHTRYANVYFLDLCLMPTYSVSNRYYIMQPLHLAIRKMKWVVSWNVCAIFGCNILFVGSKRKQKSGECSCVNKVAMPFATSNVSRICRCNKASTFQGRVLVLMKLKVYYYSVCPNISPLLLGSQSVCRRRGYKNIAISKGRRNL